LRGKKKLGLLVAMVFCFGCASIVSKSNYPVSINSSPSKAKVTVTNESGKEIHNAVTPTTITLEANEGFFQTANYNFTYKKEGYHPAHANLSASLDPWYIGNIVFGGLIGWLLVDPATGAMWKLDEEVYANLGKCIDTKPTSESENSESKSSKDSVSARLKELKELKQKGLLSNEEYEEKRDDIINDL